MQLTTATSVTMEVNLVFSFITRIIVNVSDISKHHTIN